MTLERAGSPVLTLKLMEVDHDNNNDDADNDNDNDKGRLSTRGHDAGNLLVFRTLSMLSR
ncbi:hypothetical protein [Halomonas sp. MCCC 1A11062]|uniref:hypothetical protein n=1 Tax=Halomonas sp. MCCC 1A11062 TaxID=2733485 RepID=UPI001F48E1E9|nr:hypothetical protein [Halomonas sp. MCCC 1A11062]